MEEIAEFGFDFGGVFDGVGNGGTEEFAETFTQAVDCYFQSAFGGLQRGGGLSVGMVGNAEEERPKKCEFLRSERSVRFNASEGFADEGFGPGAFVLGSGGLVGARFECVSFLGLKRIQRDKRLAGSAFGGVGASVFVREPVLK